MRMSDMTEPNLIIPCVMYTRYTRICLMLTGIKLNNKIETMLYYSLLSGL
jgi:hypothetical protein